MALKYRVSAFRPASWRGPRRLSGVFNVLGGVSGSLDRSITIGAGVPSSSIGSTLTGVISRLTGNPGEKTVAPGSRLTDREGDGVE